MLGNRSPFGLGRLTMNLIDLGRKTTHMQPVVLVCVQNACGLAEESLSAKHRPSAALSSDNGFERARTKNLKNKCKVVYFFEMKMRAGSPAKSAGLRRQAL